MALNSAMSSIPNERSFMRLALALPVQLALFANRTYVGGFPPRMDPSNAASPRARATLAATVGAICLLAAAALAGLLGGAGSAESARAKRLAQTPSDVAPGHVHGADLGVPGMSERKLRTFETRTLGPAHAREHALMRRAIRQVE